jgi:hypothetical protein
LSVLNINNKFYRLINNKYYFRKYFNSKKHIFHCKKHNFYSKKPHFHMKNRKKNTVFIVKKPTFPFSAQRFAIFNRQNGNTRFIERINQFFEGSDLFFMGFLGIFEGFLRFFRCFMGFFRYF